MIYPRVEVVWLDTCQDPEWQEGEDIEASEVATCSTMGYLRYSHETLVLSHTITDDGAGDSLRIPRGCVVSVKLLRSGGDYDF